MAAPVPIVLASVAVAALIGKTPAQVRQALSLPPAPSEYVAAASQDGQGIRLLITNDLLASPSVCPAKTTTELITGPTIGRPGFVYANGLLEGVYPQGGRGFPAALPDEAPPAETRIEVRCHPNLADTSVDIPLALYPIAGLILLADGARRLKPWTVNSDLAKLSLGQPPPGGAEAYIAHPPKGAVVKALGGGDADLTFTIVSNPDRYTTYLGSGMTVSLRGGMVSAFATADPSYQRCQVSQKGQLRCEQP